MSSRRLTSQDVTFLVKVEQRLQRARGNVVKSEPDGGLVPVWSGPGFMTTAADVLMAKKASGVTGLPSTSAVMLIESVYTTEKLLSIIEKLALQLDEVLDEQAE